MAVFPTYNNVVIYTLITVLINLSFSPQHMNQDDHLMEQPLLAVYMCTYNHEQFVAKAIESVLAQKTTFPFVYLIGEDCSTDNTRAICLDFQSRYPEIIKVFCTKENNMMQNATNLWNACAESGVKYIAMYEGDDFWIDEYKLQKQVDYMEANPDFTLCFSNVVVKDELGLNRKFEKYMPRLEKDVLTIEDFILSFASLTRTSTMVFRNVLPHPMPDFYMTTMSGDVLITMLLADKGKAKYFHEQMVVYRDHRGGITKTQNNIQNNNRELMKLYHTLNKYFDYRYDKIYKKRFLENAKINLVYGAKKKKGLARIKHYFKTIPDYLKYSDKINFKELFYYHIVIFCPIVLKLFKSTMVPDTDDYGH